MFTKSAVMKNTLETSQRICLEPMVIRTEGRS
jgi:hypothetical protein